MVIMKTGHTVFVLCFLVACSLLSRDIYTLSLPSISTELFVIKKPAQIIFFYVYSVLVLRK